MNAPTTCCFCISRSNDIGERQNERVCKKKNREGKYCSDHLLVITCDDYSRWWQLSRTATPREHLEGEGLRHSSLQQLQMHWEFRNNITYFHPKTPFQMFPGCPKCVSSSQCRSSVSTTDNCVKTMGDKNKPNPAQVLHGGFWKRKKNATSWTSFFWCRKRMHIRVHFKPNIYPFVLLFFRSQNRFFTGCLYQEHL